MSDYQRIEKRADGSVMITNPRGTFILMEYVYRGLFAAGIDIPRYETLEAEAG